jgi:hypothetical protein
VLEFFEEWVENVLRIKLLYYGDDVFGVVALENQNKSLLEFELPNELVFVSKTG